MLSSPVHDVVPQLDELYSMATYNIHTLWSYTKQCLIVLVDLTDMCFLAQLLWTDYNTTQWGNMYTYTFNIKKSIYMMLSISIYFNAFYLYLFKCFLSLFTSMLSISIYFNAYISIYFNAFYLYLLQCFLSLFTSMLSIPIYFIDFYLYLLQCFLSLFTSMLISLFTSMISISIYFNAFYIYLLQYFQSKYS